MATPLVSDVPQSTAGFLLGHIFKEVVVAAVEGRVDTEGTH